MPELPLHLLLRMSLHPLCLMQLSRAGQNAPLAIKHLRMPTFRVDRHTLERQCLGQFDGNRQSQWCVHTPMSSCIKQSLAPQSLSELHPLHSTSNPPPSKRTRRRRCRRAARRKPPPALIPIMSMPIHRQRTGGTVRGVLARIHRPLGRLGIATLRAPWGSPATCKESSESSASRQASLSVCKARSDSAVTGTGASWHHLQRDDMCCSAATSAAVQPNFREPDPVSVQEALARPDGSEWQRAIDEEIGRLLSSVRRLGAKRLARWKASAS